MLRGSDGIAICTLAFFTLIFCAVLVVYVFDLGDLIRRINIFKKQRNKTDQEQNRKNR